MTDYLPEPLPEVLKALREAVPEHGVAKASVKDVKGRMIDEGRGLPDAYALGDLVRLDLAELHDVDGVKRYRPKAWR